MPNYNEQTGTGESWQRCYAVRIDNPLDATPVIFFNEELVVKVGTNIINKPNTVCSKIFNATETFELLNLDTNQPTGQTMTHQELYQALYSLYIKTATERDNYTAPNSTYPSGPFTG